MAVACGGYHTVMVAEGGRAVLACGFGFTGQLGNGTREHQLVPGPVSGLAEVLEGALVVMVAGWGFHSAASTSEGEVMTWGYGEYGQLGHGDEEDITRPAKLGREVFGGSAVMMVSCGGFHTMAVTEVGRLTVNSPGVAGSIKSRTWIDHYRHHRRRHPTISK